MCSSDIPVITPIFNKAEAGVKRVKNAIIPIPEIPKLPDAPDAAAKAIDPVVQSARKRERNRAKASKGIQSTILTGGGGLSTPATTATKTLLGS